MVDLDNLKGSEQDIHLISSRAQSSFAEASDTQLINSNEIVLDENNNEKFCEADKIKQQTKSTEEENFPMDHISAKASRKLEISITEDNESK